MQPQRIIVHNDQNEKLVGLLHDTGSNEIVVVCHGFTGNKNERLLVNTSVALENEGISVFRFDFSGNGESEGSFEFGNYAKEVEDLHAVVKYFKGTNRSVSAIVGHSKGGDDVLLYASKYHDVRTVVNVSGRYDLKKGISERLGETFMERWNTDVHEACLKIDQQCRVLTVHGSADEIIPVEDAYEFAKIIPNHKLHIVEGANHCYTEHNQQVVPVAVDFVKACVEQDRQSSST